MPRQTSYIVQAFATGKRNRLVAGEPVPCSSANAARRMAERLAATKAGVVAYSISGDSESGDYDDQPILLFKAGRLPPPFSDE